MDLTDEQWAVVQPHIPCHRAAPMAVDGYRSRMVVPSAAFCKS